VNDIQSALLASLPPKRKSTPSGWISFDAPCCHNRGEGRDSKKRGGVLVNEEGFQYHCFNCGFKAGWTPGKLLSTNTKNLFVYLGLNQDDVHRLQMYALKLKDDQPREQKRLSLELHPIALPDNTISILELLENTEPELIAIQEQLVSYLISRGMNIDWYPWHYSFSPGYTDRIIIPFYHHGEIVGYTGRKMTPGKPKYLTDSQSGYVFNLDRQSSDRKYICVVEGQFDAIGIDGVAVMTNEINATQIQRIQSLGKEVILVPDRDRAGAKMINAAIDNGWSVSVPPWSDRCKDVADAVKLFGRLYTLQSIIYYRESNPLKIKLIKKRLENYNE